MIFPFGEKVVQRDVWFKWGERTPLSAGGCNWPLIFGRREGKMFGKARGRRRGGTRCRD